MTSPSSATFASLVKSLYGGGLAQQRFVNDWEGDFLCQPAELIETLGVRLNVLRTMNQPIRTGVRELLLV